jgi:hypothetical protein
MDVLRALVYLRQCVYHQVVGFVNDQNITVLKEGEVAYVANRCLKRTNCILPELAYSKPFPQFQIPPKFDLLNFRSTLSAISLSLPHQQCLSLATSWHLIGRPLCSHRPPLQSRLANLFACLPHSHSLRGLKVGLEPGII